MFPSPTDRRSNKRSLRELVRGAVDTALEFATLGEARLGGDAPEPATSTIRRAPRSGRPAPPAPTLEHPHRRPVGRPARHRRPGTARPRMQVCTSPVLHHPARH